MSYKYRTVRVRGTELVGTIDRKRGSAAEICETSKNPSTSVVPVFFKATGEARFSTGPCWRTWPPRPVDRPGMGACRVLAKTTEGAAPAAIRRAHPHRSL
jgi:hypothetical protein